MRRHRTATWNCLVEELHRWSDVGRRANLFIRDDDACAASPALDRLLKAVGDAPLGLSVIPGKLEVSLIERLAEAPRSVQVWHHGWSHENRATEGFSEYPRHRPPDEVETELVRGKAVLSAAFGTRSVSIFVPPWSGFDESFFPILGRLGFEGFSGFLPRARPNESGVAIVNAQCELLTWTPGPTFAEDGAYLETIIAHLRGRRERRLDRGEPTGVLWHHGCQTDKSYAFLSRLVEIVDRHEAASWCQPLEDGPTQRSRKTFATAVGGGLRWVREASRHSKPGSCCTG